jgi:hypothetical protein
MEATPTVSSESGGSGGEPPAPAPRVEPFPLVGADPGPRCASGDETPPTIAPTAPAAPAAANPPPLISITPPPHAGAATRSPRS